MALDIDPEFYGKDKDNAANIKQSIAENNKKAKKEKAVAAKPAATANELFHVPTIESHPKKTYSSLYLPQDDWKALKKGAKMAGYSSVSSFVTAWVNTWKKQIVKHK